MSQPAPTGPEQPEPVSAAEPDPATEPDEEPAPLNRAARRAKAKKGDPTHVGPRGDLARQTRGGRPHTKRHR